MHPYFVEFLGTFFLMAAILYSKGNWIIIGITLGVAVLLGGKISGGCFNPAVTLGSCMANNLPYSEFLPYVVVELLGAALAAMIYAKTKKRK